jgi:flagellar operon protein (TIGR03826 family)
MNVENCPRCGKIFAKNFRDVCPNCMREIDKEYENCANYLRENKGATIIELSEATEVSIKQITKFIREGRISMINAPNLSYPCESCGTLIRDSHICDICRARLDKDKRNMLEDIANKEARMRQQKNSVVYKSLDKYKGK